MEAKDNILEAFDPFRLALQKNETDTLGRLTADDKVLFKLSGCWTGSAEVTLGDLRKLARAIDELRPSMQGLFGLFKDQPIDINEGWNE